MRTSLFPMFKVVFVVILLSASVSGLAQIKYTSQGRLAIGNNTYAGECCSKFIF